MLVSSTVQKLIALETHFIVEINYMLLCLGTVDWLQISASLLLISLFEPNCLYIFGLHTEPK